MSDQELLKRCKLGLTQNINESCHAKVWSKCLKTKKHGLKKIIFSARQVMLEHNMGRHYGSLHVLLGSMSKSSAKTLLWLRSESIRRATNTGNKRNTRLARASLKARKNPKVKHFTILA